jgi:hypothetical protein
VERSYPVPVRTTHRLSETVWKPQLLSTPLLSLIIVAYFTLSYSFCKAVSAFSHSFFYPLQQSICAVLPEVLL